MLEIVHQVTLDLRGDIPACLVNNGKKCLTCRCQVSRILFHDQHGGPDPLGVLTQHGADMVFRFNPQVLSDYPRVLNQQYAPQNRGKSNDGHHEKDVLFKGNPHIEPLWK
jgi:hypothetical protein